MVRSRVFKRGACAACPARPFTFTREPKPGVSVVGMRCEPVFVFFNRSFGTLRPGENVCLSKNRVPFTRSATDGFAGEPQGLIVTVLPFENVCDSEIAPRIIWLELCVCAEELLGLLRIASFEQLSQTKRRFGV